MVVTGSATIFACSAALLASSVAAEASDLAFSHETSGNASSSSKVPFASTGVSVLLAMGTPEVRVPLAALVFPSDGMHILASASDHCIDANSVQKIMRRERCIGLLSLHRKPRLSERMMLWCQSSWSEPLTTGAFGTPKRTGEKAPFAQDSCRAVSQFFPTGEMDLERHAKVSPARPTCAVLTAVEHAFRAKVSAPLFCFLVRGFHGTAGAAW